VRDAKIIRRTAYTIITIILIWSGLWVLDAECSTADNSLSSDITGSQAEKTIEKETRNIEQKQSEIEMKNLEAGQEMFRSGNFKEARKSFDNVLRLDSRNVKAQYFLGLIEYEEGNIEKAKLRFQIAHECSGLPSDSKPLQIGVKQAQLQFPDDYQARIYYKDGWYIKSKNPSDDNKTLFSLDAGSSYKIELKSKNTKSWLTSGILGSVVLFSFLLAR